MIEVKKKNKSYKKRKLVITIDKEKYYIEPYWGWYCVSTSNIEKRTIIREIVIDNLYWLLGCDCDFEIWTEEIEKWDKGKLYNTPLNTSSDSLFFNNEEKERALKSFYNI